MRDRSRPPKLGLRAQVAVCALVGAVATFALSWMAAIVKSELVDDGWPAIATARYEYLTVPNECTPILASVSAQSPEVDGMVMRGMFGDHLVIGVSARIGDRVVSGTSRVALDGSPMELTIGWAGASAAYPERWGNDLVEAVVAAGSNVDSVRVTHHASRYGWPWRALWGESKGRTRGTVVDAALVETTTRTGGAGLLTIPFGCDVQSGRWNSTTDLPYLPLIGGFTADMLLFGGVAWLLSFGAPGAIRRVLRRSAGRCIQCGYDLRASTDRCPECGSVRSTSTPAVHVPPT